MLACVQFYLFIQILSVDSVGFHIISIFFYFSKYYHNDFIYYTFMTSKYYGNNFQESTKLFLSILHYILLQ